MVETQKETGKDRQRVTGRGREDTERQTETDANSQGETERPKGSKIDTERPSGRR